MGRSPLRLLLAALALLLVVGAAWLVLFAPRGSSPAEAHVGEGGRSLEPATARSAPATTDVEEGREDVSLALSEDTPPSPATAPADELRGLVVDEGDAPVAGAAIAISRNPAADFSMLAGSGIERWRVVLGEATTDGSGRFAMRLPRGVPHEVVASHADFVPTSVRDCYAGMDVTLRLTRGGTISGKVVYEVDGSPASGARVGVWRQGLGGELYRGVADEQGEYRTPRLDPCAVYVVVQTELGAAPLAILEIRSGEDVRCDVSIPRGAAIFGTVRDSRTGMPVAEAEVSDSWAFDRSVRTNMAGVYVLEGYRSGGREFLSARAPGYAQVQVPIPPVEAGGRVQVDFDLAPGRRAVGRLVKEEGSPIADALVRAVLVPGNRLENHRTTSRSDGRFEILDLSPEARYTLLIQKDGYGTALYEFPPPADPTLVDFGDIVLAEAASLEGLVVNNLDGAPVPDVAVELSGSNKDRERFVEVAAGPEAASAIRDARRRQPFGVDIYVARRARRADGAGRFAFDNLPPGDYQLTATSSRVELMGSLRVSIDAGERRDDLRLVVPVRATISGRVIGRDGQPSANANLRLKRADDPNYPDLSTRAREDGAFVLEAMQGKTYHLIVLPSQSSRPSDDEQAAMGAACVFDLVPPVRDLEVRMGPTDVVSGVVRDSSGSPVAGMVIDVLDPVVGQLRQGRTDAHGIFKIRIPPRPSLTLKAFGDGRNGILEDVPSSASQLVIELPDKP
jgi:protocatechuate 3,4-dioxygenase beta subunit